jgi:anti-sigma28 factor (negative regulator of flagellin synthesis)
LPTVQLQGISAEETLMRIDSNLAAQSLPDSARTGNPPSAAPTQSGSESSSGISSSLGEDQAQLSVVHGQIPAWVEQTFRLPGPSPAKVDALRQAVLDGSYRPALDQVAGAIFANMVVKAAA